MAGSDNKKDAHKEVEAGAKEAAATGAKDSGEEAAKKTRKDVQQTVEEADESFDESKQRAGDVADFTSVQASDAMENAKDAAGNAWNSSKDKPRDVKEDAPEKTEQAANERTSDIANATKDKASGAAADDHRAKDENFDAATFKTSEEGLNKTSAASVKHKPDSAYGVARAESEELPERVQGSNAAAAEVKNFAGSEFDISTPQDAAKHEASPENFDAGKDVKQTGFKEVLGLRNAEDKAASNSTDTTEKKAEEATDVAKENVGQTWDSMKAKTGEAFGAAQAKAGEIKEKTGDAINAGKQKANGTGEAVKEKTKEAGTSEDHRSDHTILKPGEEDVTTKDKSREKDATAATEKTTSLAGTGLLAFVGERLAEASRTIQETVNSPGNNL